MKANYFDLENSCFEKPDWEEGKLAYDVALRTLKEGAEENYDAVCELLVRAIENNFVKAWSELGVFYFKIKGDRKEALRCFQLGTQQGDPLSMFYLGFMMFKGCDCAKDVKNGLKYIKNAADLGVPKAVAWWKKRKTLLAK